MTFFTADWSSLKSFRNKAMLLSLFSKPFMRRTLAVALLIASSFGSFAQKTDNFSDSLLLRTSVFADLGLCMEGGQPGLSVTCSKQHSRHFGLGIGAQGYFFDKNYAASYVTRQFIPSLFLDAREYMGKHGRFFLLQDLGIDIYHGYANVNSHESASHEDGLYFGFGLGYSYPVSTKISAYLSLKFVSDSYISRQTYQNKTSSVFDMDGTSVISAGIRF